MHQETFKRVSKSFRTQQVS